MKIAIKGQNVDCVSCTKTEIDQIDPATIIIQNKKESIISDKFPSITLERDTLDIHIKTVHNKIKDLHIKSVHNNTKDLHIKTVHNKVKDFKLKLFQFHISKRFIPRSNIPNVKNVTICLKMILRMKIK